MSSILPPKKNFIQAKYDFIDEMLKFSGLQGKPLKVLDVGQSSCAILFTHYQNFKITTLIGCGIGGTSRYLAKKFGEGSEVLGITLSPKQVARATSLAEQQQLKNAKFQVMEALEMSLPDNTFDLVWACESGEHMPDKKKYVEEMTRVLKPGGKIVIATWCQRDDTKVPFNAKVRYS